MYASLTTFKPCDLPTLLSSLQPIAPLLDTACQAWTYEELDPDLFGEDLATPAYAGVERIAAVWLHAVKRTRMRKSDQ